MKYKVKEHRVLPLELRTIKSVVNSQEHIDKTCGGLKKCDRNIGGGNGKLRRNGQRHHFYYDEKMNILRCVEYINAWDEEMPSKYFITRSYIPGQHLNLPNPQQYKLVEESELYYCRDCMVYCWTKNSIIRPYFVWHLIYGENLEEHELMVG